MGQIVRNFAFSCASVSTSQKHTANHNLYQLQDRYLYLFTDPKLVDNRIQGRPFW
jgi:hypothetical protein